MAAVAVGHRDGVVAPLPEVAATRSRRFSSIALYQFSQCISLPRWAGRTILSSMMLRAP
jgi:hypothetical protein